MSDNVVPFGRRAEVLPIATPVDPETKKKQEREKKALAERKKHNEQVKANHKITTGSNPPKPG